MAVIIIDRSAMDGPDATQKIAVYMAGFEFNDMEWIHNPCGERHSFADHSNGERVFTCMLRHVAECPKLMTILGPVSSWAEQPVAKITTSIQEFLDTEIEEEKRG